MPKTLPEELFSHLAKLCEREKRFVGVEVFYHQFHQHGPDAVMEAIFALRQEGKITTAGHHLSPDAISVVGKVQAEDE